MAPAPPSASLGLPAKTHGSLDLGMRVPSSLILSLMLNRLRRSTLEKGEKKEWVRINRPRREEEKLGHWRTAAGKGAPRQEGAQSEKGLQSMLARARALTHLGCDCPSSAVPSKGPWPLFLEENESSQVLLEKM